MDDIETVESAPPERLQTAGKKSERPYSLMVNPRIYSVQMSLQNVFRLKLFLELKLRKFIADVTPFAF